MMSEIDQEMIKTAAIWMIPILVGVIGWFVRKLGKVQESEFSGMRADTQRSSMDMALMRKDIEILVQDVRTLMATRDDVMFLKSENKQIWRKFADISGQ